MFKVTIILDATKLAFIALFVFVACGVTPSPKSVVLAQTSSGGVIQACKQKIEGMLRVVNSPADCRESEISISWNIQGNGSSPGGYSTLTFDLLYGERKSFPIPVSDRPVRVDVTVIGQTINTGSYWGIAGNSTVLVFDSQLAQDQNHQWGDKYAYWFGEEESYTLACGVFNHIQINKDATMTFEASVGEAASSCNLSVPIRVRVTMWY